LRRSQKKPEYTEGRRYARIEASNRMGWEEWKGSSWLTSVHARVVFSLIILQIYPCNKAKYIQHKCDMLSKTH